MQAQDLAELAADGHHRIERGHRLLKDHGDVAAAHGAQFVVVEREDVDPIEADRAADDAAGGIGGCPPQRRRIAPPTMRPGGSGISRISDSAVTLLPHPDSPTIASVSPRL